METELRDPEAFKERLKRIRALETATVAAKAIEHGKGKSGRGKSRKGRRRKSTSVQKPKKEIPATVEKRRTSSKSSSVDDSQQSRESDRAARSRLQRSLNQLLDPSREKKHAELQKHDPPPPSIHHNPNNHAVMDSSKSRRSAAEREQLHRRASRPSQRKDKYTNDDIPHVSAAHTVEHKQLYLRQQRPSPHTNKHMHREMPPPPAPNTTEREQVYHRQGRYSKQRDSFTDDEIPPPPALNMAESQQLHRTPPRAFRGDSRYHSAARGRDNYMPHEFRPPPAADMVGREQVHRRPPFPTNNTDNYMHREMPPPPAQNTAQRDARPQVPSKTRSENIHHEMPPPPAPSFEFETPAPPSSTHNVLGVTMEGKEITDSPPHTPHSLSPSPPQENKKQMRAVTKSQAMQMWKQQNPPPAPLSNPHRDLLLSDTSTTAGSSAPLSMVEEGSSRTPSDPVNRDRNSAQVPPAPIVSDGDDDDEVILHDFTPERSADKNPIPPPPPSTSENDSATPEQKIHQNTQKNSATSDSRKDDKGEEEDVATPLSPPPNNTGPVFTCDVDETTKEILGGGSDSESEEMVLLFGDEDSKDDGGLDKFLDGKKNDAPVTPANSVGSPMSLPSPSPSPAKERTPVKREWARVGITPWRRPSSIRSPAIDPGTADTPTSKPDTTKHETNLDLTTPEAADTPKSSEDRAKPPVSPVRLSRVVKGKDVDESDVDTRVKCLGCGFICADIKICIEHLRTRHGIQDQVALQSCLSTLVSGGDDEPEPPMSVISEFSDDEASVLQRPSSLEKLSVGDKVVIVSGGNIPDMLVPAALKGVIVKIHPDKTADINNEEGELTEHVPLAELRRSLGEIQQLNSLRFLQSFESVQNIKELVKKKNKKATPAKRKSSRRSSVSKAVSKQTTPLKSNNGKKKADSSEDEQSGEGAMPPTPGLPKDEREQMRRVLCQVKKFFDILLSMEATAELLDFESRIFRALRDYNKHNQSPKTVTLRRQHPDDSWGLKLQCHSQLRCCGWTSAMRLSIVSIAQKCKRTGKATPASLQKKLKPGLLVWYVDGTVCRSEEDFISRASSGLEMQLQVLRIGRVAKKKDKRHVRDMFRLQTYHQALLSANAGLHYARDPKWIRKLLSFQN